MKKLIVIPFLLISLLLHATNYHFATAGNDVTGDGSIATPWQTITKANSLHPVAGDSINFKRGDTFYGTLAITHAGSVGNQIIYGAYGVITNADPIITGFTTLSSWTSEGGSIYSKVITSAALTNMVTVDGVQIAMGRYPDTGWRTYESLTTNTSITDNGLGDATDWAGAEAVIRKSLYRIDRCLITDHLVDKLTYTNLGSTASGTVNYGYFIQNDIRCVTTTNEWFHNQGTGTFYIYGDPAAKVVKVATLTNLMTNNGYDYITVDNINFQGSISDAITFTGNADNCIIQNNSVTFAGKAGILMYPANNATINNNIINNINRYGIGHYGDVSTMTNNTISSIGMIIGQGIDVYYSMGIYEVGTGSNIAYNSINLTAYNGIMIGLTGSATVQYNLINNALYYTCDGGGIYTTDPTTATRTIDHNIILNTIGNFDGAVDAYGSLAEGIYLDDGATNVVVTNNTIANCGYAGIHMHMTKNCTVTGNISFNNLYGIWYQNNLASSQLSGNTQSGNQFFAKGASQYAFRLQTGYAGDVTAYATSNNNYFVRPVDDDYVFKFYDPSTSGYKTLTEWKTYTSQDAASLGSLITIADTSKIDFYYNATDGIVVKQIPYASMDVTGTKYNTTDDITLDAYESIVLMEDPDPDSDPPDLPTITQTLTNYSLRPIITSVVSGANVGTVSSKGICYNTTGNPTTSDTKTVEAAGIGTFTSTFSVVTETTYYVRTYAISDLGTTYSSIIEFTTPASSPLTSGGKQLMSGGKQIVIK